MEEHEHLLHIVTNEHNFKSLQGMAAIKLNDLYFIWIWHATKIIVYETPTLKVGLEFLDGHPSQNRKLNNSELNLDNRVVDIFHFNGSCVYGMDTNGLVYLFELSNRNPTEFMDADDLFSSSPPSSDVSSKWKKNMVSRIEDCDYVMGVCHFATKIAVLVIKDNHLMVVLYSFPQIELMFSMDLHKFISKEAVLSSCNISSLSPSLRHHFQDNLDMPDSEIVIIGLLSGLVLWFSANAPLKGPFLLFSAQQQIQKFHWIKDTVSRLYTHLLVVLSSGPVVVFGPGDPTTLHLPDSVKASCSLRHYLITSNLIDSFSSELKLEGDVTINCVSLPVKGVCAMTSVPDSDVLLLAATVHGSIYCLNPTIMPSGDPSHFTIPEQSLLDRMFTQTQNLESVYKKMNREDKMLKAVSTAIAARSFPQVFNLSAKILSDTLFSVTAKLAKSGIVFSQEIWLVYVEVLSKDGVRETTSMKLKQDFSSENELIVNASHSVAVGSVISMELVSSLENQQPLLIVPIHKIEIDACHLMTSQALVTHSTLHQENLKEILQILNKERPKQTLQECKLIIKIPTTYTVNSVLSEILKDSQHRISVDEWNKISVGTKMNVQVNINNILVSLNLEAESRELTISCCDANLCHQVKEAILKRLANPESKRISDDIVLDIQGLFQGFEIESMKNDPDFQYLELLRKKLRLNVSCQLPL